MDIERFFDFDRPIDGPFTFTDDKDYRKPKSKFKKILEFKTSNDEQKYFKGGKWIEN